MRSMMEREYEKRFLHLRDMPLAINRASVMSVVR